MPINLRDFARSERVPCFFEAEVVSSEKRLRAECLNLSLSGAFFVFKEGIHLGTLVDVYLPLNEGKPLLAHGTVARRGRCVKYLASSRVDNLAVAMDGMGVEFDPLTLDDIARLSDFLDHLLDR